MIIFDNIIFSLQKSGGISVVWKEFYSRLINKNNTENYYFIDYNKSKSNFLYRELNFNGNILYKFVRYPFNIQRFFNPKLKNIKEKFIFHSTYYRICKNPLAINITTVHDFTYEYYRKGIAKFIHCKQKYNAIRKSQYIICVSENTKKDLLKYLPYIDESKIHVIYNGISDKYFPLNDINTNIQIPYARDSFVLFVGSRAKYKNFDFVVENLFQQKYNLVIVGSPLTNKEKKHLEKFIPQNKYKVLSFVSEEYLNMLYNYAIALVYPSSYEGFGIPILEAQKAGCPVIALYTSSIPEIIGETPLLMRKLTGQEFISKLNLLSNKTLIKIITEKGIINAQKYSWDKMYNEIMNLYYEILK